MRLYMRDEHLTFDDFEGLGKQLLDDVCDVVDERFDISRRLDDAKEVDYEVERLTGAVEMLERDLAAVLERLSHLESIPICDCAHEAVS